ncbi:MAG: SDR family oxidoreductase [Ruegeria sp.]|uniref:SDR family oxidoreductase n=1 Tax=Ruegeria sp. TaxID=1879320 RepID=UPI00349E76A0
MTAAKHVLILGAYGFIGASVARALVAGGHRVTGLARDVSMASRVLPGIEVIDGDLRQMTGTGAWRAYLDTVDVVVNCAGALQDGGQDDLAAVHHHAIAALGQACAQRGVAVVQISAIGAEPSANTAFMRTKAEGDAALRESGARLWVLRPGLVIGQTAYGGTGLLRMLAGVPVLQPLAMPRTPVQCVGMDDLCRAVVSAVRGELPEGTYDLVEDQPQSLAEVVAETRRWLGFAPARVTVAVPRWATWLIGRCADGLGALGWRSPLRSTALTVMQDGVLGDPGPYRQTSGQGVAPLSQVYAELVAAREHRLAARMSLLMPLVIAMLSLFWLLSGLFGLIRLPEAAALLTGVGWPAALAVASVIFWSLVDIALGAAVLWRPWAARACLAQIAVALLYLIAATWAVPALWADPLGPLVKILPALMLSLVAHQMLESR